LKKKDDENSPRKLALMCIGLIPTPEPSSITLMLIGNSNLQTQNATPVNVAS